jgi:hypothetical protein
LLAFIFSGLSPLVGQLQFTDKVIARPAGGFHGLAGFLAHGRFNGLPLFKIQAILTEHDFSPLLY